MISYQIKTDGRFFCIFSSLALIHQPRNIFIPATCYSDTIVFLDKPGWTTFHHLGPSHCSSPSSWMEELVFFKLNSPSKGKKVYTIQPGGWFGVFFPLTSSPSSHYSDTIGNLGDPGRTKLSIVPHNLVGWKS